MTVVELPMIEEEANSINREANHDAFKQPNSD
jgi:hypothetical protein